MDKDFIEQTLLFAAEVGKDVNSLRKMIGDLKDLPTADKSSLIAAILEMNSDFKDLLKSLGDPNTILPDWATELDNQVNF